MQHLDEGTIHAWIDGELSPEQAGELEAHVKDCAACAAMVAEARGLVAASTRILTALDHVPGGVLPSVPDIAPAQVARRRWYQRTDVRAAAAFLFVAGASLVVARSTDVRSKSAMIATADKAPAEASSSVATETVGGSGAEAAKKSIADAANASPLVTAPANEGRSATREALSEKKSATTVSPSAPRDLHFGGVAGAGAARNQVLQQKVMADDRAATGALRDELKVSKGEASKRRAAEVAELPPPPAAPMDVAAATAAAPAEMRLNATRGSVEGRVTDKNTGQGVTNAQVTVEGTTLNATTDNNGQFRIENVPLGPQRLRVRRIGYAAEAASLTIEAGKAATAQVGIGAAPSALAAVVVTGAAAAPTPVRSLEAAVSKGVAVTPLRIVRADTISGTKRTIYEVARGVEVTLTESSAETESDFAAKDAARQKAAAPQRAETAREAPQVLSARTGDARPAPPAAPVPLPLNTISWTDRGKRYTLTGRLTVKDLEAVKGRLMQTRR